MIKILTKILIILLSFVVFVILYLTFFGINTKQLNNHINSQVLNINPAANLELKKVKILLNPKNLTINLKTFGPKIVIDGNKLEIESIKTNVSLKSLINKEFSIDNLKISTKLIQLKDLILLARSFKKTPQLFILDNVINDGYLVGDINLNFDVNGKIEDNYEIKGFIKKGKLSFLRRYFIEDLNLLFNIKNKQLYLEEVETSVNKIKLSSPSIKIEEKNNQFFIFGKVISKKENINIKLLSDLFENSFNNLNVKNVSFSSNNDFTLSINKKFKINNFNLKSRIDLDKFVYKSDFLNIKNYIPDFEKFIQLEDHIILINYKKNQFDINGKGKIKIKDKIDTLEYKIDKKKDHYLFSSNISIDKNLLSFDALQYEKKENLQSKLKLNGIYKKNKKINFSLISFIENQNNFLIKNLNLDNNFKILNIEKLNFNYVNKNKIKNQIKLEKNKNKYQISGKSFDASKLINVILHSDEDQEEDSSSIFSNLNTDINIKIDKTYLDKTSYVKNLSGNINLRKNEINDLKLKSIFLNNKELIMTISTNKNNEKITTLFTDQPKPLVGYYKFIKGFEEGALDYYSIKKNNNSKSVLKINNFKLQEVPVLAKILTLASLQGIADLLTGEGIRFTDFEMKFSNTKGLMSIEEIYAIGPAISILMDGYIETKKLISLRGTLVPATTINKTIASIPIIGDILVGKKTGEGVFGVSFKIKGPPNNLKTTVNPIKTLTPRFITRTLEKIKKN